MRFLLPLTVLITLGCASIKPEPLATYSRHEYELAITRNSNKYKVTYMGDYTVYINEDRNILWIKVDMRKTPQRLRSINIDTRDRFYKVLRQR